MLGGQRERVDILANARTAQNGILQNRLEENRPSCPADDPISQRMELTSPEFRLVCAYDRRNKVLLQTASFFFLQLYVLQGAFVAELAGVVSVTTNVYSSQRGCNQTVHLPNATTRRLLLFCIPWFLYLMVWF